MASYCDFVTSKIRRRILFESIIIALDGFRRLVNVGGLWVWFLGTGG